MLIYLKHLTLLLVLSLASLIAHAQNFEHYFCDSTLRIDYILSGNIKSQTIAIDGMSRMPGWYGKRQHMTEIPVHGAATISVRLAATGEEIYKHTFSTLFQEWLDLDDASLAPKAFECVELLPMPRDSVIIEVKLFNPRHEVTSSIEHKVYPNDCTIVRKGENNVPKYVTLNEPANPDKAEILGLSLSVRCPVCGSRMKRFHVEKRKKQYWKCTKDVCRKTVYINDADLIEQLKDIMFELTAVPYEYCNDYVQKSINSAMLEKTISERLASQLFDKNEIKEDILRLSEMLYMDIPNTEFVKMKITSSLKKYSEDQYLKTINEIGSKIEFNEDNNISLVLRDGSRYVRKAHHADRREDNIVYRSYQANC